MTAAVELTDDVAPGVCKVDRCEGARVRSCWYCEAHWRETIDRVCLELADPNYGRKRAVRSPKPAPSKSLAELSAERAVAIARVIHKSGSPMTPSAAVAAARLGSLSARTVGRAVEHAREQGWVVSAGRGRTGRLEPGSAKP